MFARFVIEAITSQEELSHMAGVGLVIPEGGCFVHWVNRDIVNGDVKETDYYPVGISHVIDIVEVSPDIDFKWVDDPEDGGSYL